jgi:hypothetical protein
MTSHASVSLSCVLAGVLVAAATGATAQGRRGPGAPSSQTATPTTLPSDPLAGGIVANAPYSGDGVTTVTQTLGDGTRIEQKTQAKFYRDSAGRIRREQTILGLAPLNRSTQAQTVVTIDSTPDDAFAYTLDPATRRAVRVPRGSGALRLRLNGTALDWSTGNYFGVGLTNLLPGLVFQRPGAAVGATQADESLGTRQIEGVRTTGRKTTSTIPAGRIGNDRPIEITDEQWESPDLKVLVYSRFSDPRTGVVEFKLTNINRAEPPPDLFAVPTDYTILEPGASGVRGGGVGGRGGRGQQ